MCVVATNLQLAPHLQVWNIFSVLTTSGFPGGAADESIWSKINAGFVEFFVLPSLNPFLAMSSRLHLGHIPCVPAALLALFMPNRMGSYVYLVPLYIKELGTN